MEKTAQSTVSTVSTQTHNAKLLPTGARVFDKSISEFVRTLKSMITSQYPESEDQEDIMRRLVNEVTPKLQLKTNARKHSSTLPLFHSSTAATVTTFRIVETEKTLSVQIPHITLQPAKSEQPETTHHKTGPINLNDPVQKAENANHSISLMESNDNQNQNIRASETDRETRKTEDNIKKFNDFSSTINNVSFPKSQSGTDKIKLIDNGITIEDNPHNYIQHAFTKYCQADLLNFYTEDSSQEHKEFKQLIAQASRRLNLDSNDDKQGLISLFNDGLEQTPELFHDQLRKIVTAYNPKNVFILIVATQLILSGKDFREQYEALQCENHSSVQATQRPESTGKDPSKVSPGPFTRST